MKISDRWSLAIEGTHAILCGLYSTVGLVLFVTDPINYKYYLCIGAGMGSQLMNSLLYMSEYVIQTKDQQNVNYDSDVFPTGKLLSKRPFMYINILWTVMPCGILISYLV